MEDKRQVPWEKAEAFAQQEGLRLGNSEGSWYHPPIGAVFELNKLWNAFLVFGWILQQYPYLSDLVNGFGCSSAYSQRFPEVPVWFGGANHEHRGFSQGFCLIHLQWAERMSWDSLKLGFFHLGWRIEWENLERHVYCTFWGSVKGSELYLCLLVEWRYIPELHPN